MTSEVKPGQVWQSKNMGWEVRVSHRDHEGFWWVSTKSGRYLPVREGILFDDYVLVKEAP